MAEAINCANRCHWQDGIVQMQVMATQSGDRSNFLRAVSDLSVSCMGCKDSSNRFHVFTCATKIMAVFPWTSNHLELFDPRQMNDG